MMEANPPDFSDVPFRLNFMLFSEKNHVKALKNQWVLPGHSLPHALLEPHAENKLRHLRGRGLRSALTEDNPTAIWTYNLLRTQHFHGVPSARPPVDSLKSRYGKVRLYDPGRSATVHCRYRAQS